MKLGNFTIKLKDFFKFLTKEAILADAVTSISAEEWMDFLVSRISDINMLKGDNLSAVTFIVRNTEDIRIDQLP